MRKQYLERATNFDDISIKRPPNVEFKSYQPKGMFVLCPLCKGHGRWNLELNAYGPGVHFQHGCNQCNGYGWVDDVEPRDVTCIHDYREHHKPIAILGHALFAQEHLWVCRNCGRYIVVDSSG